MTINLMNFSEMKSEGILFGPNSNKHTPPPNSGDPEPYVKQHALHLFLSI